MNKKSQYKVIALNLNDKEVAQTITANSAQEAADLVTRKNKYLRVQSVTKIETASPKFEG